MMKSFLLTFLGAFCLSFTSTGQIQTPAPSPLCVLQQTVGMTDITVEYSRPGKKDRVIFGGLVPYNEVWRTGANAVTKLTFSTKVNFGGEDIDAGEYALLTKPGRNMWEFMLYPYESRNWGSYLESEVRPVMVKAEPMENSLQIETMMFVFDWLRNDGGVLVLAWDKVMVPVEIKVPSEEMVEASIKKTMGGPSAQEYYSAASYYLSEKKDMEKAYEWINMAIDNGYERYWTLRTKALIQAEMGDKDGAVRSARKSLELAKEAGNNDYIRMNEASIKEWTM